MKPVQEQKNLKTLFRIAGSLYPLMKILSPANVCTLDEVGRSMVTDSTIGYSKRILENSDIRACALR
jgi:hypothetical protein